MILIAGATGYVGRYLCKYMVEQGEDILALGRSGEVLEFFRKSLIPCMEFDITADESYERLPHQDVEAVINLAAVLAEIATPVETMFSVNTIGTYKLLEYCRSNDIRRFVQASSHKVYNDIHHIPLKETDSPCFTGDHSPYIISKIAAENFVEYYTKDFGMQGIILRLTGVHGYGEILGQLELDGSYKKSTFEIFVAKAKNGDPLEVWGDCQAVRDHIYIKDVLTAFVAAVESPDAVGVYNIATGIGLSLLEEAQGLVDVFSPLDHRSPIVRRPEMPAFTRSYVYDISRARHDLRWEPKYSYIDMLQDYRREQEAGLYHHYHYIKPEERPATM
jgi:UDP-glucose 4-epimerase